MEDCEINMSRDTAGCKLQFGDKNVGKTLYVSLSWVSAHMYVQVYTIMYIRTPNNIKTATSQLMMTIMGGVKICLKTKYIIVVFL